MNEKRENNTKGFWLFMLVIAVISCGVLIFFMMMPQEERPQVVQNVMPSLPEISIPELPPPKPITKDHEKIENLPKEYTVEAKEQGTLETVKYDFQLDDGSGEVVTKKATVYLPYGYDASQKYDVLYLVHGYGGSRRTFLGKPEEPRPFKIVLDNMIANRDIEPLIVVTPTYTDEYNDYYASLDGIGTEVVESLIPLIEEKYSCYGSGLSDPVEARDHRAFGGFSMGGCATWRALKNYGEYFRYYMPMSMPMYYSDDGYVEGPSAECAAEIVSGMEDSGLKSGDFCIFAASGDEDFMCKATKNQVRDLCEYDLFQKTDTDFRSGNIMFHSWEGRKHSYKKSNPYIYNGLIRFFRETTAANDAAAKAEAEGTADAV